MPGMNRTLHLTCLSIGLVGVSACGMLGDTDSIKAANQLAINCQYEEALGALRAAETGGGLGAYLAQLERVVVLRDAGRTAEADQALKDWYANNADSDPDKQSTEESLEESLAKLQEERRKATGQSTCS